MNKLKSEVKALTYHEVGAKLDDQLESAEREQFSMEGAKIALTEAKNLVEQLLSHVDKDVQEGVLDVAQATLAKRWVMRSMQVVQNLALRAEVQNYQSQGKVLALRQTVKVAKSLYDAEKANLDALIKAETEETETVDPRRPDARVSGTHPGDPLADRREKGVAQVEVDTSIQVEGATQVEVETSSSAPEEPPPLQVEEVQPEDPSVEPTVKSTTRPAPKKRTRRW